MQGVLHRTLPSSCDSCHKLVLPSLPSAFVAIQDHLTDRHSMGHIADHRRKVFDQVEEDDVGEGSAVLTGQGGVAWVRAAHACGVVRPRVDRKKGAGTASAALHGVCSEVDGPWSADDGDPDEEPRQVAAVTADRVP